MTALEVVAGEGLANLSFGRVAKKLGISDRTVVYYFPTKADLIEAVVLAYGTDLQDLLERAFGPAPLTADELVAKAWPVLATKRADPTFSLLFQLLGLASAGLAPYEALAAAVMSEWVDWLMPRVDEPGATRRRGQARAVVAQLDGLLLLRQIAGPKAAADAAAELGITEGRKR